jgi:phenylalanyl-tRNA synthetase alpha chain
MIDAVFGPVEKKWVDAYFPFTEPSFELEIFYNDKWLEVLGCGVVQQPILDGCDMSNKHGWAFGLGLERLAMVLFDIFDIRLFWTDDERFTKQFKAGTITKFQPYSKFPPCYKDIAFWIPEDWQENNFAELVRNTCGDIVESVELIDQFTNPKKGKTSHCYRINYRAMDRSLTNEEVDKLQEDVRSKTADELKCELR